MNNPKISLIVIYNNEEANIQKYIESIFNQNFKDFELICVNNASTDNSEKLVVEKTIDYANVKRLSFPNKLEIRQAQKEALMLVSGEYVCFLDSTKEIDENYISNLYKDVFATKNNELQYSLEKMYKREVLENIDIIDNILENKFNLKQEEVKKEIEDYKISLEKKLNEKFSIYVENMNNKFYDSSLKIDMVEKTLWEKDYHFNQKIQELLNNLSSVNQVDVGKISEDISNVYNYINEQIHKIYDDISKVYEEITKNYKYTEGIVEKAKQETISGCNDITPIENRINELEKNVIYRHVGLKRLLDNQVDELNSKIQSVSGLDTNDLQNKFDYFETSKIIEKNIENIYKTIDRNNSQFYEELTKIYQDINQKTLEKIDSQKYYFDKQINDLREEFNKKLEQLKTKN